MDAARIIGTAVNTTGALENYIKYQEAKAAYEAPQAAEECTLQISGAAYHRWEAAQRFTALSAGQPVSSRTAISARQDPLTHAMTNLTDFMVERAQLIGSPNAPASTLDASMSPEASEAEEAQWDALENSLLDSDADIPEGADDALWDAMDEALLSDDGSAEPGTGSLVMNLKMQELTRGIRSHVNANLSLHGTVDAMYEQARKSLTMARQEDQVLRNGLSALYRYVVRDTSLSAKDRADAINRFVAEGRQTLARIENSLGYRLAQLRCML